METKILIIDNTFDPPQGCPEIRELLVSVPGAAVSVSSVRAPDRQIPRELDAFDGVVISGSKTRILDEAPWISEELDAIRRLHALRLPTLGICYGEQMMALAFGGPVGVAKTYEYGWVEIEQDGSSPIFAGLPQKFHSFEFHADEVLEAPAGFRAFAWSSHCRVQALEALDAPMWGVQFHPERGVQAGESSLQRVGADSRRVINAGEGPRLFSAAVGQTIFRNFLSRVRTRR